MPIEQLSNTITFYAMFVASKVGKTGLTVTIDVWECTQAGVYTEIVSGGSATELGDGVYYYALVSGSVDAVGEYVAIFKTADTSVDQQHIPAAWTVGRAGVEDLDAAISSRAATGAEMDLVDAPNATAVTAIQSGLSTLTQADILDDATPFSGASIATIAADVDTELTANHGSGSWQGGAGSGSVVFEYTVTDSSTAAALEGVTVWVTTDDAGANMIASGTTNASGKVSFWLDAGTYYFWRRLAGYAFSDPDTEVVT